MTDETIERLKNLEARLGTLERKQKRMKKQGNNLREDTTVNHDKLNSLSKATFYNLRRTTKNEEIIRFLLREQKEKREEVR